MGETCNPNLTLLILGPAIAAAICLGIWLFSVRKNTTAYPAAIAAISYCVHVLLFSTVLHFTDLAPDIRTAWSAGLRIHGLLLLIMVGLLARRKSWI